LDIVSPAQKFAGAIAVGFIWSIGAAADALARGMAAAGSGATSGAKAAAYSVALSHIAADVTVSHGFRVLDPPLTVSLSDKIANDEKDWLAVATAVRSNGLEICVVKGDKVEWRQARDKNVRWSVADGTSSAGVVTAQLNLVCGSLGIAEGTRMWSLAASLHGRLHGAGGVPS
jgi:hypothetical protein